MTVVLLDDMNLILLMGLASNPSERSQLHQGTPHHWPAGPQTGVWQANDDTHLHMGGEGRTSRSEGPDLL